MSDTPTIDIPDRDLFKAADVCELLDVQPYVLRSWESEFPDLGVTRPQGGARIYRRQDVERVVRIKHLLLVEGLTLAGARRRLEAEAEAAVPLSIDADAVSQAVPVPPVPAEVDTTTAVEPTLGRPTLDSSARDAVRDAVARLQARLAAVDVASYDDLMAAATAAWSRVLALAEAQPETASAAAPRTVTAKGPRRATRAAAAARPTLFGDASDSPAADDDRSA